MEPNQRRQSLTLRIPWAGVEIELRGLTIVMALLLVMVCGIAVLLTFHSRDAQADSARVVEYLALLKAEQSETTKAIIEANYISLLTPAQREALRARIQMPESLQRKLR